MKVENENVLEQALRTYEESERSLKLICHSIEQENDQLEEQLKSLQIHEKSLIKEYHLFKERLHQIRGEHARLAERQLIFDQQTKHIQQRYEQVQLALKKVLSLAISSNEQSSSQTFAILGFKFIPIDQERCLTNHMEINYHSPSLTSKRRLTSIQSNEKHRKTDSSSSEHLSK